MVPFVSPPSDSPLFDSPPSDSLLSDGALPAAGLPAEAVSSLRRAFARETRVRLPRLLDVDGSAAAETLAMARTDARVLAEGCALLGDAAGARALRHLEGLLTEAGDREARRDAARLSALLLGRWAYDADGQSALI
jgi:hypothetical protein